MTKKLTADDISKLNHLLDETLHQSDKEHLIACIRVLSITIANLKIKYHADNEKLPEQVSKLVSELQQGKISQQLTELVSKSVVECASALAAAKNIK